MPKLVVFSTTPVEYNLEEGSTSIGRGKANDIILEEKSVSKRHAIITCQAMKNGETKVQIADLHSTNGTLVNGNKISYHTLEDSDQLSIGSVQCAYLID
jgi:pSer/pThr/pTyr-binding forkhead associated (FHA) protein